ncbi:MAG: hypothetical protein IPI12_16000 [Ignavibacteriales bacterium]|nr:hypothetical protein [Ignavibacteriales bacterium]
MYSCSSILPSYHPESGNRTRGTNDVTASGTASVTHHIDIKIAIAAQNFASWHGGERNKQNKRQNPQKQSRAFKFITARNFETPSVSIEYL